MAKRRRGVRRGDASPERVPADGAAAATVTPVHETADAAADASRPSLALRSVGVIGELLITAGVLIALFLAWQLWWTDVEAAGEHRAEIASLEQAWGRGGQSPDAGRIAPEQPGDPPAVPVAPENTAWAVLHVPAFENPEIPVGEGVTREGVLNVIGAGHYPGTAMPGEVGNFSLAGHRTTYGKPFHDIANLKVGDPIVLETADAYYVYTVTDTDIIIRPDQVEVIAPVPGRPGTVPTERSITLTACHPFFSARLRFAVHGRFAYWTKASDGIPAALAGSGGH